MTIVLKKKVDNCTLADDETELTRNGKSGARDSTTRLPPVLICTARTTSTMSRAAKNNEERGIERQREGGDQIGEQLDVASLERLVGVAEHKTVELDGQLRAQEVGVEQVLKQEALHFLSARPCEFFPHCARGCVRVRWRVCVCVRCVM